LLARKSTLQKAANGAKKKVVDIFSKKDWYDVKASAMFNIRNIGKTLVTRTQGTSEYFILVLHFFKLRSTCGRIKEIALGCSFGHGGACFVQHL